MKIGGGGGGEYFSPLIYICQFLGLVILCYFISFLCVTVFL
jgi:hypothetical protein